MNRHELQIINAPADFTSRLSRLQGPGQQRAEGPGEPNNPELMQQYMDYMILDPSRSSSVHMQTPLLDPYTYHKVHRL